MRIRPTCLGFALLAQCAMAAAFAPTAGRRELTIAQWNVENLFDADDNPNSAGDDPYTPRGWEHWTDQHYRMKLEHLADVLDKVNADIVCVEEIENRRVLDDLNAVLKRKYDREYPYILHREGGDHRGIDVAMLCTLRPATNYWLSPVPEQRDVLAAEFDHGGHRFMVLANHWKSRFGSKKVSDGIRMTEAKAVRQELDRRLYANPRAAILMAGDFNNDCDGVEITEGAGCVPDLGKCLADPTGRLLFNLHGGLVPEARGTLFYKKAGTWNSFDSISVTKAMLDQPVGSADGWRVRPGSYEVLRFPFALDPDKRPLPFRRVVDSDGGAPAYHAGYSDHLPVRVVITLGP